MVARTEALAVALLLSVVAGAGCFSKKRRGQRDTVKEATQVQTSESREESVTLSGAMKTVPSPTP